MSYDFEIPVKVTLKTNGEVPEEVFRQAIMKKLGLKEGPTDMEFGIVGEAIVWIPNFWRRKGKTEWLKTH